MNLIVLYPHCTIRSACHIFLPLHILIKWFHPFPDFFLITALFNYTVCYYMDSLPHRYNKNFSLYSSENLNVRENIMFLYFVHCSMSLIRPDRVRPPPPIVIQCINIINSIIKSYQYHIPASIFSGNLSSLKNVAALLFFPLLP